MNDSIPAEVLKDDDFYKAEAQRYMEAITKLQQQISEDQEETRLLREDTEQRLSNIFAMLGTPR